MLICIVCFTLFTLVVNKMFVFKATFWKFHRWWLGCYMCDWSMTSVDWFYVRIQFHLVQWNQFIVLTCIEYVTLSIRLVIICLWCYTCDCDATLVIVRLHVWFWGYTCDCDVTRVIVMQHVWLWGYTCDCDAARVIVRLHVWLCGQ